MRLIDADELKSKKEYSKERREYIIPVAAIDWMKTVDATQSSGWIPFTLEYSEKEERKILTCPLPDDEQEIFVTDGKTTWQDTFMSDGEECWLDDSGCEIVTEVTAWQPLLEPYKYKED